MADEQQAMLDELLSACLHQETDRENVLEGFRHRLKICRAWDIPAGSQILDIGCGQGESSLILALLNGPDGLVTGIDNGPPEYGAPITTGDARSFIEAAPLGRRIRFQMTEAPALLAGPAAASSSPPRFDAAVAMHSLWYFDSEAQVRALFAGLARARVGRVYLAEYTGVAGAAPAQRAHQRAAEAQIRLHAARRPPADAVHKPNVRAALPPARLVGLAGQEGWRVRRSGVVEASDALMDGHWEAQMVKADSFRDEVRAARLDPDVEADILRLSEEVKDLVQELSLRGARAQCMDSFWAVLSLDDE